MSNSNSKVGRCWRCEREEPLYRYERWRWGDVVLVCLPCKELMIEQKKDYNWRRRHSLNVSTREPQGEGQVRRKPSLDELDRWGSRGRG